MATDQAEVAPEVFLDAPAWHAPAAAPASSPAPAGATARPTTAVDPHRHRRTGSLLLTVGLVVIASAVLVGHSLTGAHTVTGASVAVLDAAQRPTDVLSDDDVARLVVRPGSTRLLVTTDQGAHYAARSASGELCLLRVPAGDLPSEVCVPDRVGADATIGTQGAGQVRLVADGAMPPPALDGWRVAGPNVWVRG